MRYIGSVGVGGVLSEIGLRGNEENEEKLIETLM